MARQNIATGAKAVAIRRWQDQCFLIDGWQFFSDKGKGRVYDHVVPIEGVPASEVVSTIAQQAGADAFLNFNPAQMAILVPQIRLYLVKYKGETNNTLAQSKLQEIRFDDHVSSDNIEAITDGGGRGSLLGLKNFSYEFDGKDEATAEKMIKCKFTISFTDFDAFTSPQYAGGPTPLDLVTRYPMYTEEALASSPSTRKVNPKYQRIKAVIGWAVPDDAGIDHIVNNFYHMTPVSFLDADGAHISTPDKRKLIKNLLEEMKLDLFLDLTGHKFNFKDDGVTELTLEYRASIEGELLSTRANILAGRARAGERIEAGLQARLDAKDEEIAKIEESTNLKRRLEQVKEKLKGKKTLIWNELRMTSIATYSDPPTGDTKDSLEAEKTTIEENLSTLGAAGGASDLKTLRKERANLVNLSAKMVESRKLHFYNRFVKALESDNGIHEVSIPEQILENWQLGAGAGTPGFDRDVEIGEREAENTTYSELRKHGAGAGGRLTAQEVLGMRAPLLHFPAHTAGATPPAESKFRKLTEGIVTSANKITASDSKDPEELARESNEHTSRLSEELADPEEPPASTGNHRIFYTHIGHIINVAMQEYQLNLDREKDPVPNNMRILLGNIAFQDPITGNDVEMNIADIPVSIDEFSLFWFHNVVKIGKTQYFVMDFIRDIMTKLFYTALGKHCFGGAGFQLPIISRVPFSIKTRGEDAGPPSAPQGGGLIEPFPRPVGGPPGISGKGKFERVKSKSDLVKLMNKFKTAGGASEGETLDYLLIHATARAAKDFAKSEEQDSKAGIYHIGIGRDSGVVKKVKFKSSNMKFVSEARVIDQAQEALGQLFEKYDATIKMYGAPFFRNGQYIYINPTSLGVKDASVAAKLGLGGYYVIYSVKGEISKDGYETSLECKFNNAGIRKEDGPSLPEGVPRT